ncbi:hypothetical protein NPIL_486701 [Nephila pilipes]|uniref:Uncharacterized protein n=1 Tax=Nephila pilipes TaxID=299642 RepID=A0A8X6NG95_NEPPI|nr:hypothetical protein NPIL_486701 [Nephila pilipes]
MKAFTNPCRITWSNASVLSGTQTGRTVDEGAAGKASIVSESERATDEKAPNRSFFYTVPNRMGRSLLHQRCSRVINGMDGKVQERAHALRRQPTMTFVAIAVRTRALLLFPMV